MDSRDREIRRRIEALIEIEFYRLLGWREGRPSKDGWVTLYYPQPYSGMGGIRYYPS